SVVATKKERIKTMSEHLERLESTSSIIPDSIRGDIRRQGDFQREADRKQYIEDIEARRNRPVQQRPAKQEINLVAELDSALSDLELGAQDFEKSHGKINEPLVAARLEVEPLRSELTRAEAKL